MSSRDPNDLHPILKERWYDAQEAYVQEYPALPQPFLVQTYRSVDDQNADYAKGRTVPGKIITNAKGGQSLHNYMPALAFDIAFKDSKGSVDWNDEYLFENFAKIAKRFGLAWGGDWKGFKDKPHFQPPNFTWHDAANHKEPVFPEIS